MIEGLVSTVIPVYNRPKLLLEAVDSVLAQNYHQIEIVVVDDGSDEPAMASSLDECLRLGDGKVRVVRQRNQGPGAARQHGLEHAQGEFVQFLDSDDVLYPIKFQAQIDMFRARPEVGVVYGKTRNSGAVGWQDRPWKRTGDDIDYLFPTLLAARIWDTSTPLYRTSLVREIGGWSNLTNEEDWEFDCRIAELGVQLARVEEWVSEQRGTATNRASTGGSSDPVKLQDRAKARHLILESALRAGIPIDAPEFQTFIRYSFLVARQCAAAGLSSEAENLVRHLNSVAPRKLMGLYLLGGNLIGYKTTTRVAHWAYRNFGGGRNSITS
jgi:Glycosyl transferase family 2